MTHFIAQESENAIPSTHCLQSKYGDAVKLFSASCNECRALRTPTVQWCVIGENDGIAVTHVLRLFSNLS